MGIIKFLVLFYIGLRIGSAMESKLGVTVKDFFNVNCGDINETTILNRLPSRIQNASEVTFCFNSILLNETLVFQQLTDISFTGYNSTFTCSSSIEAGFKFLDVKHLKLSNFNLINCSFTSKFMSDGVSFYYSSGIFIQHCFDVNISAVRISRSSGKGLVILNTNGRVEVNRSTFDANGHITLGGNGVYVDNIYSIENKSCLMENNTFIFKNCTFNNNRASSSSNYSKFRSIHYGRGGGLGIYLNNYACNNSVLISDCVFDDNQAYRAGGGLFVSMHRSTKNNHVHVWNSSFANNKALYGGGAYVGYISSNKKVVINGTYLFELCMFDGNSANYGGGTSLHSSRNAINSTVIYRHSTWTKNSAFFGSAMSFLPNSLEIYDEGNLPSPVLDNCTIRFNINTYKEEIQNSHYWQHSLGVGTVYCSSHSISVKSVTNFINNGDTAVYLSGCKLAIQMDSVIRFVGNTGLSGGAIYLLGNSIIKAYLGSILEFINNTATHEGGAIFYKSIDKHEYDYSFSCFIEAIESGNSSMTKNNNVTFFFHNNRAGLGNILSGLGHSIYASSLVPCRKKFAEDNQCLKDDVFDCIGIFEYSEGNRSYEKATSVTSFTVDSDEVDANSSCVPFIPGAKQNLPFKTLDELNQTVHTILQISISSGSHSIKTDSLYLANTSLKLFGSSGDTAYLSVSTLNILTATLSFCVEMQQCPAGFVQSETSYLEHLLGCVCSLYTENFYVGISKCDLLEFRAYRSRGYWIGYDRLLPESESTLVTGFCTPGFCIINKTLYKLPSEANRNLLSSAVCTDSREGILCGLCIKDYSTFYHSGSFVCGRTDKCHLGWMFYVLSQLVPVTVFFTLVLIYGISFTSGSAHGFIFFSQVVLFLQVNAGQLIHFPNGVRILSRLHQTIYNIFNLNYFVFSELSFCLMKSASALDILAFGYVTLLYAFSLILLLVYMMKRRKLYICLNRMFRIKSQTTQNRIIHGLSTFLVVCYSFCAQKSLLLLTSTKLWGPGGEEVRKVVKYNGEIEWFSVPHLRYALPALFFFLIIVIAPPVLLLTYPLCYKLFSLLSISESKAVKVLCMVVPLEKLKPFFDSFQSCFKDEYRFFSGLYFVYRFTILLSMASFHYRNLYLILEIQLVLMLIIHSACQPYKERTHNLIDTLLFGNLALINGITMFNFSIIEAPYAKEQIISITSWIQVCLILLPLFSAFFLYTFGKLKLYLQSRKHNNSSSNDGLNANRSLSLEINLMSSYRNEPDSY